MDDENEEVVAVPDHPVRCALLKAAEIVEERWCQGRFEDLSGAVCALGAIGKVVSGNPQIWRKSHNYQVAVDAALALAHQVGQRVIVWNDESGRTKEEVAAAMRAAARHLR